MPGRDLAFLTAIPDPEGVIDGLIAAVAPEEWDTLNTREAFYDRHDVSQATRASRDSAPGPGAVALYAVPESRSMAPHDAAPVLLSYLDVVAQGYLDVFGESGLDRFLETTDGWEVPFLDDRAEPLYPRAQPLAPDTRDRVDAALAARGRVPRRP
ncbi:gamma-glutamylcyclotransferase [Roseivivax sediminis]|uniref:Uncharacterized protein n=1 Tax=Roseivivax sediminis TaxID=936889 RepID=A0A1I2BHP1_9RHOB|nr:gamma-glutamylcyclotransferase [Roseivivax sediminis]SFE54793.1 hypothetical protein SAMN04515678_11124 [Roseivivax sediminis]